MKFYADILANIIIRQYFINSRCFFIFTDDFNTFSYSGDIPSVKIEIFKDNIFPEIMYHNFGCQEILIKTKDPVSTFIEFERQIRICNERFNERKFLIVPCKNCIENSSNIFAAEELKYVSNLVLISPNDLDKKENIDNKSYYLITHNYVGKEDNNAPIILDTWFSSNQSFLFNRNLYPDKLSNQQGRRLLMGTFAYKPYSIIGPTLDESIGSEMVTAKMYASFLNVTPILVVNYEDYWGEIYDNWTGNGLLGNLVADRADIGFSALYAWSWEHNFLDLTKLTIRSGVTCLVPAPELAGGWLTPLFSYSNSMWISVIIMFSVSVITLCFINVYYSKILQLKSKVRGRLVKADPIFDSLGKAMRNIGKLLILQSLTNSELQSGFIRQYFMTLMFMLSLLLSSTYSSGLASIMTLPRYKNAINTANEFIESGLQWGALHAGWITSIENVKEPFYEHLVKSFTAASDEVLGSHSRQGHFAFAVERLPYGNFAVGPYIKYDVIGNYRLLQEDFYWEQCVMYARKSSILLPSLDKFILRAFETGLIPHWQNQAVALSMDPRVQKVVSYYNHYFKEQVIVKLKWMHVEGAFALLCFGHVLSILVFIAELVFNKCKKKQTK